MSSPGLYFLSQEIKEGIGHIAGCLESSFWLRNSMKRAKLTVSEGEDGREGGRRIKIVKLASRGFLLEL
jgi:hypothetical protein